MSAAAPAEGSEYAPIHLLGEILARRLPLENAREAFADEVTMHADDYAMQGSAEAWMRWVAFMWDHSRLEGLHGEFETFVRADDGTVTGTGRWYGRREGHELCSPLVTARYRVVEGRIVEMWSIRTNYTLILGTGFATPMGFWLTIARFGVWSLRWRNRRA